MHLIFRTAAPYPSCDAESFCAVLEVTPALLAWIRTRVDLLQATAVVCASRVELRVPHQLEVYTSWSVFDDREEVDAATLDALDALEEQGWCVATSTMLAWLDNEDDDEGPAALDTCELRLDTCWLDGAAEPIDLQWLFRLRHRDVKEYTHWLRWSDMPRLHDILTQETSYV